MIAKRRAHCFISNRRQTGQHFLERLRGEIRRLRQRRVEPGDVGGVVLAVVDFHGLRIDVRLQRVERIGQAGKRGRGNLGGAQPAGQQAGSGGKSSQLDESAAVDWMRLFHAPIPLSRISGKSNA